MDSRVLLGRITIKIVGGVELHDTNILTRMDPYVEVKSLNPKSFKFEWRTAAVKNGARNPNWEGESRVIDVYDLHDNLGFSVYSDNKVKTNSLIGEMRASFRVLSQKEGKQEHILHR